MKLREWAAREGVHYQTAWRWWRDGKLPIPARQTATGTILVEVPAAGGVAPGVVVYATTRLAQHHDVIVIEDLNVAGMRRKPGAAKAGGA